MSAAACLCAPRKRRGPLGTRRQVPGAHPIASLLLSTHRRIPASPLPAFSRFMVEAACTGVAAAGLRGDAGGSSVAGGGARCWLSSRRSPVVSRRACVREKKQDGELRCIKCACHGGHGAGSRHFTGLARRSEQGGGRRGQDSGTWGNPPSEGFRCREAAAMKLSCRF